MAQALLGIAIGVAIGGLVVFVFFLARHHAPVLATPSPSPVPSVMVLPKMTYCGAQPPATVPAKDTVVAPSKITINLNATYVAKMVTSCGIIRIDLYPRESATAVNNFVYLANKVHWYDGLLFNQASALRDLVQTGDANCTNSIGTGGPPSPLCGKGDPGYRIQPGVSGGAPWQVGSVAMLGMGKAGAFGSQFLIVTGPKGLNQPHTSTIFGRVESSSFPVLKKIEGVPTAGPGGTWPIYKIWIYSLRVTTAR